MVFVNTEKIWKRCATFRRGRLHVDLSGYECSTDGELRHGDSMQRDDVDRAGYIVNSTNLYGCQISFPRHRVVLATFFKCPDDSKYVCDHINGDPRDNRLVNLRWVTRRGNCVNRKTAKNYWFAPAQHKWRVDFKKKQRHVFVTLCDTEEHAQRVAAFVRKRLIRDETVIPPHEMYTVNENNGITGFVETHEDSLETLDGSGGVADDEEGYEGLSEGSGVTNCEICGEGGASVVEHLGAFFCSKCKRHHTCKRCHIVRLDRLMPCQFPCL